MPGTINVFVVKIPQRHMSTAERVVCSHQRDSEIHWISVNDKGHVCVEKNKKRLVFHQKELKKFTKENDICSLYVDNYFNKENIFFINGLKDLPLFVVNYGVYFCKDEISYTFAKYFRLTNLLVSVTRIKLLARDIFLALYGNIKFGLRKAIYRKATVLFWNEFSKRNFERDYSYAQAEFVPIATKTATRKSGRCRLLVTPSQLGGRTGKAGREELKLWKDHVEMIKNRFPVSDIHLSLHPLYEGKHKKDFINQGIVSKIFVGVSPDIVKDYDMLFTDTSTLFWVAESYYVQAYFLEGYQIPRAFFDKELVKKSFF